MSDELVAAQETVARLRELVADYQQSLAEAEAEVAALTPPFKKGDYLRYKDAVVHTGATMRVLSCVKDGEKWVVTYLYRVVDDSGEAFEWYNATPVTEDMEKQSIQVNSRVRYPSVHWDQIGMVRGVGALAATVDWPCCGTETVALEDLEQVA